ncbi:hypothetical protein [Ilumatobacter sp.]|uniref:hypothetical protein n=1 Tax=Ilumatobacter sp. TaxID=1967498 RepID=UPI003B51C8FE
MRLLASSIGLVALLAMAGLASGSRGPVGGIGSTPDIDELVVSVGSTTPSPPAVDDPTDLASPICVELQQVRALSDEVSVIIGDALEEMTAPPGEMDEALVLARFRDAADLIDRSLPDLLDAYESAARMAPAEVAADLGAVEDGTALLAPTIVDTMRAVRSLDGLGAIDRALATPEMADAAVEAGQASLRLDGFTIPTCGFSFSNASP